VETDLHYSNLSKIFL